ncbi:MAG: hypothetical protein H7A23_25795 [Leptospiraceae bacterium]|nr:hypothetical protein [Leptospiraceae bacterium]MCP5497982.1 hypothetical protein [Leptospiraceae bacterium]
MIYKIEEANQKLREGEFENAKRIYSDLLDIEPENEILVNGYFISSYWDNRLDMILTLKEGRERGTKLVQLFDEFETEIGNRKLSKLASYEAITQCILSEASLHFRIAYHNEGTSGLDKDILLDLSVCLIKTGDYKNALEVIEYSKTFQDSSSMLKFFKAECYYHLGNSRKSQILFREGLLHDPDQLRLDIIKSEPLQTAIKEISGRLKNEGDLKEYLPVYCLEKKYFTQTKEYSKEELKSLYLEMNRLEESLQKENREFNFKINCRILQIGITILDSLPSNTNNDLIRKVIMKINQIDSGFLDRRKQNMARSDVRKL